MLACVHTLTISKQAFWLILKIHRNFPFVQLARLSTIPPVLICHVDGERAKTLYFFHKSILHASTHTTSYN